MTISYNPPMKQDVEIRNFLTERGIEHPPHRRLPATLYEAADRLIASKSRVGFEQLTRPKSYHVRVTT
jgi:hypothetical protein